MHIYKYELYVYIYIYKSFKHKVISLSRNCCIHGHYFQKILGHGHGPGHPPYHLGEVEADKTRSSSRDRNKFQLTSGSQGSHGKERGPESALELQKSCIFFWGEPSQSSRQQIPIDISSLEKSGYASFEPLPLVVNGPPNTKHLAEFLDLGGI